MSPQRPGPRELVTLLVGLLALVAFVLLPWQVMGPTSPILALVISAGVFGASPLLSPAGDLLPARRLAAGTGELSALERLGVRKIAVLLERSGWNRGVGRARAGRTRSELIALAEQARRAQAAHAIAAGAHLLGAALLTADGGASQAIVLLALGALLHALPVLLQRWVLGRIARSGILIAESH